MDKRGFTPLERKPCPLGEHRKTFSLLRGGVKNTWGFTLIELLITIAIIGILAGVAVTAYVGTIKKAARSEAYSNLESLRLLEEQFFAENAVYTGDMGDLPGFKPGPSTSFTYALTLDFEITDNTGNTTTNPPTSAATATPCFVATATGIANTRVDGDVLAIDCNNNRNF